MKFEIFEKIFNFFVNQNRKKGDPSHSLPINIETKIPVQNIFEKKKKLYYLPVHNCLPQLKYLNIKLSEKIEPTSVLPYSTSDFDSTYIIQLKTIFKNIY